MSIRLVLLAFALLTATVVHGGNPIDNIAGIYVGLIDLPFMLVLRENLTVGSACLADLTDGCRQELPLGHEELSIVNNSFAISYTQFVGINTLEKAREAFPTCAESGIYPFETKTPLPLAPIQFYNPLTGMLTFIDDRRPHDVNCVYVKVIREAPVKVLQAEYVITSEGTLDEVVTYGPSFRCDRSDPDVCVIQETPETIFNYIYAKWSVPCASGPCTEPPTSKKPFRGPSKGPRKKPFKGPFRKPIRSRALVV